MPYWSKVSTSPTISTPNKETQKIRFTFAAIADIHSSINKLHNAIDKINQSNAKFTIIYGDVTDVGAEEELEEIYKVIQKSKKITYILPGDHDLWSGRDKTKDPFIFFNNKFGKTPQNFIKESVHFIFVNNADIYKGIPEQEYISLLNEIENTTEPTIILNARLILLTNLFLLFRLQIILLYLLIYFYFRTLFPLI